MNGSHWNRCIGVMLALVPLVCFSLPVLKTLACNDKGHIIHAEIETKDLILRSIGWEDGHWRAGLYGNAKNMKLYLNGEPQPRPNTMERATQRAERWRDGNPFSSFVIMLKEDHFKIGEAVCGHGYRAGQASLAIVIHHDYQKKGYGLQVTQAFFQVWLPELVQRQSRTPGPSSQDGQLLAQLHASARCDNISSKMLEKVGFKKGQCPSRQTEDGTRAHYYYDIDRSQFNKQEAKTS